MILDFYAPASPGTEVALRDELCELGLTGVRLNRGGIPFRGRWRDGWYACLHSRIAQRIQVLLATFEATSPAQLYEGVRDIDWTPFLSPALTLSVSAFSRSTVFTHSGFVALKAKDALVDSMRDRFGARPDVDKEDPDVRLFLYVSDTRVKVYLDLSGEALYRRGCRAAAGEAPLRETLAAALLRMSGWDRTSPLADPMCGAGTIVIEAAMWAGNIAPGIFRERFGFERWAGHDETARELMREMRGQARAAAHRQFPRIIGSDADAAVLELAQANAKTAGVRVQFRQRRIEELQLGTDVHLVITNPPYDQRLATSEDDFRAIAAALSRLHGKRVCILSGNPQLDKMIPAVAASRQTVKNGNLDCEFLVYTMP
jgi:23S rRNA G2445 N2-methylase RlmL